MSHEVADATGAMLEGIVVATRRRMVHPLHDLTQDGLANKRPQLRFWIRTVPLCPGHDLAYSRHELICLCIEPCVFLCLLLSCQLGRC